MTGSDAARRARGLRAALGIGRLAALGRQGLGQVRAVQAARRLQPATRRSAIKATLMAIACVLGFWGFQSLAPAAKPPLDPWAPAVIWQNLFRTLQLLTTQFPPNLPTDLPLQLQIARFAMPIFAVWIAASALLRRFNRPLLAWFAALSREHVVLLGASELAQALARAYRALGRPVVAIVPPVAGNVVSPMEVAGARLVFGAPTDAAVLRRAGAQRAAALIAVDDLGTGAVALASAVAAANDGREPERPLTFFLRLANRELRGLMASEIAAALRESRVDLRLYVRERTVARGLLGRYPADWGLPPGAHDLHAVIVGLDDMGAEILLQLARVAVPAAGRRTVLTVIDRRADGLREQMLAENPGLAECAELRFVEAEAQAGALRADEARGWLLEPVPATAIYVCSGDDQANLSMAIALRRACGRLGVAAPPLFVHQRDGNLLVDALPRMHAGAFDALRVVAFGGLEQEADPYYLVDEEIDGLARQMHEAYLRNARGGAASVPWAELPDTYRTANRSQADHAPLKLRALGLHATTDAADKVEPPDADRLEQLARQEHERWCRDRWLGGWSFGATRDDANLRHPDLVPYDRLSEPVRDLDRQTIRNLPALLGELGIGLRRDLRIGVWFETPTLDADSSAAAMASVLGKRMAGRPAPHLQLVLPLRSPAEVALATTLARGGSVGVDVALLRRAAGGTDLGAGLDRDRARELIAAADRAFTLDRTTGEGAAWAALRAVCHVVLVARPGGGIEEIAGVPG